MAFRRMLSRCQSRRTTRSRARDYLEYIAALHPSSTPHAGAFRTAKLGRLASS